MFGQSTMAASIPLTAPPGSKPARIRDHDRDRQRNAWMAAAQAGDMAAYTALLRDCLPLVRRIVRRHGTPPDHVEDVLQDVLLTVHRVRHTYDPARCFTAWLHAIAYRRTIDLLRSQGLRRRFETHAPDAYEAYPDQAAAPEEAVGRIAEARRVRQYVAQLPQAQRQAVEQMVLADRSPSEAAVATRTTPGALKISLHRAVRNLRARMTECGGEC